MLKKKLFLVALGILIGMSESIADPGAMRKVSPVLHRAMGKSQTARGTQESMLGGPVSAEDPTMDVFVRGTMTRSEVEAVGATVHSVLGEVMTARIPPPCARKSGPTLRRSVGGSFHQGRTAPGCVHLG
ncbi:MAG: hypothetical protein V1800_09620 [Candidatus Latescibacterota bacterium]